MSIFLLQRLLDPKFSGLFDNYRRCYADILYRWGLLEARVLVTIDFLKVNPTVHIGREEVSKAHF